MNPCFETLFFKVFFLNSLFFKLSFFWGFFKLFFLNPLFGGFFFKLFLFWGGLMKKSFLAFFILVSGKLGVS
ncbi:hypothetical protein FIM86_03995 [Helicobacter pylori]|nr:hypothetical protein FIM86_03995 [Helicobacter pylori]